MTQTPATCGATTKPASICSMNTPTTSGKMHPTFTWCLEHWVDLSENQTLVNDGFMVWANVTHDYNEASMGYPSDFGWASYQNQSMSNPGVVSYPESHDEERLMYKPLQYGNGEGSTNDRSQHGPARQEAIQCFNILLPVPKCSGSSKNSATITASTRAATA